MDIARLIKMAAVEAVEADKPVAVMFANVISSEPLTVEVEHKLQLSGEQLAVINGAAIQTGDTVVLLREQGGQRFIVLGGVL